MAKAYCDRIEKAGYRAGIYANTNYWVNKLNDKSLEKYERWEANYGSNSNNANGTASAYFRPSNNVRMWQYTSCGKVKGIAGNVDMNALFY